MDLDQLFGQLKGDIAALARRIGRLESQEARKAYGLWASRPTSPYNGQIYLANDNPTTDGHGGIIWVYNTNISRWVAGSQISRELFQQRQFWGNFNAPGAGNSVYAFVPVSSDFDIYVELCTLYFDLIGAQSAVNNYSVTLTGATITANGDTRSLATGGDRLEPTFARYIVANTNKFLALTITQNGAPGNVNMSAFHLNYRLLG